MNLFRKRKPSSPAAAYDAEKLTPVLMCSICTGEQTAGFQDKATGKFLGVVRIASEKDLAEFRRQYGITGEIKKIY